MSLIAIIASYGSYFFLYRMLINLMPTKALTKRHIALITAIAGSLSAAFANPFWFVNTRLTVNKAQSIFSMIKTIYVEEGVKAFFKGVLPNMILVINPIINFVIYEQLKKKYKNQIFFASSVAKLFATLATYPILAIRTQLQASRESSETYLKALLATLGNLKFS